MKLTVIAKEIGEELDRKEALRESAMTASRSIVRRCGSAIRAVHKGERNSAEIAAIGREIDRLNKLVAGHPDLETSGAVEAAHQEFVEARVLLAISVGAEPPGHRELFVSPQAYLEGVGDAVGELRRMALTAMMSGDVGSAARAMASMDELYDFLMQFDYPAALAGVRRKQDVARSLVEKTRGELAVATAASSLERRLEAMKPRQAKKRI